MADKVYSAEVDINYGDAYTQTRELMTALDGLGGLFRTLAEDGTELDTAFMSQVDAINTLRGKVDDVTDQLKAFGEGGVQAANALEGIADPARRIAAGLELVKAAAAAATSEESKLSGEAAVVAARFEIQEAATKRLLDATLRMNPGLSGAAGHIEKIGDAQKRASAAAALFSRSQEPVGAVERAFGTLGDEVSAARAKFASLPPLMQGAVLGAIGAVTAGSLALAHAVGTVLHDAWTAWAKQSRDAIEVQEDLDESTSRLMVSLGQLAENLGRVTDAQAGAGKVADETTGILDRFNATMEEADPKTRQYTDALGDMNRQMVGVIPGVGGLFSGVLNLTDALADLGEEERQQVSLLQATNPLLFTLAAQMDNAATATLRQTDALDSVKDALKDAADEAQALKDRINDIEDAWDDVGRVQGKDALRDMLQTGTDVENRLKEGAAAAKALRTRIHDDNLKRWVREMEDRKKALQAVADMERRFQEATVKSGDSKELIDKYADDPTIKQLEAAAALFKKGNEAGAAKKAEADLIRAENKKIADSYDETNAAMSAAADGAINFGIDTAIGIAQALASGESLGGMWRSALASLGTFAVNTGKTLVMAGLGKSALDLGLPGAAIMGIGAGMVGLGLTLGGLFGGSGSGGSASVPRASGQIAAQREAWTDRNRDAKADRAESQITVVAQFGDDRLEPTVTRLERSAQRNGRTSSGGRL